MTSIASPNVSARIEWAEESQDVFVVDVCNERLTLDKDENAWRLRTGLNFETLASDRESLQELVREAVARFHQGDAHDFQDALVLVDNEQSRRAELDAKWDEMVFGSVMLEAPGRLAFLAKDWLRRGFRVRADGTVEEAWRERAAGTWIQWDDDQGQIEAETRYSGFVRIENGHLLHVFPREHYPRGAGWEVFVDNAERYKSKARFDSLEDAKEYAVVVARRGEQAGKQVTEPA